MAAEENGLLERAEALKNEGNALFQQERFALAVEKYNDAIELNPEVPAYYSNRAFCHLKLESYGLALADATVALELDKTFVKAYYRRGSAYMALAKYKDALKDFKAVRQLRPSDRDAMAKYKACDKEVKREAFERAIHTDEPTKASVLESLDVDAIAIEESYAGPRISMPLSHESVVEVAQAFKKQQKLHTRFAFEVLIEVKKVLEALPSLVDVDVPEGTHINVCGDTHGQYYDLLNIFELHGYPSETNPYLFNGDFVDRGSFSVEVVLLLFCFKVLYPQHLHLTRGNHESLNMNKVYGFEGEVRHKYSAQMFQLYTEVFHCLPLAYVLGKKALSYYALLIAIIFLYYLSFFVHAGARRARRALLARRRHARRYPKDRQTTRAAG